MIAPPLLIGLAIGFFVLVITWAYWDYRNGKNNATLVESLDITLLGLIVILFFTLGLYLAYFS